MDRVAVDPHTGDDADLSRKADAIPPSSTGPLPLKKKGGGHIIDPRYGIDLYGDNLFTTETRSQHSERVGNDSGDLKGRVYAIAHKEEIIGLILRSQQSGLDQDQLRFEAETVEDDRVRPGFNREI